MHHTLKLYSRHRELSLKFYLFCAWWTGVPLIGWVVRRVGNWWGRKLEGAYLLKTTEAEQIIDSASELALGPCACRQLTRKCDSPI
ncbi:MAG: ferredoxin-like protein, partial [Dehalococcoidia bacterium]|nr:ferredoxin-like protein [Dehalococcoidia bacterium]